MLWFLIIPDKLGYIKKENLVTENIFEPIFLFQMELLKYRTRTYGKMFLIRTDNICAFIRESPLLYVFTL